MNVEFDLQVVAMRLADLGPVVVLDEETEAGLDALVADPAVVAAVAERIGNVDTATAWLDALRATASASVQNPDGDHALLVGGLAALGSLISANGSGQSTIAFEAVALA